MQKEHSLAATYRFHAYKYWKQTMVMSFTQVSHPSYQAILALGEKALPFLMEDIKRERNCVWGCISLVFEIVGRENGPVIPEKERGRYGPIRKIVLRWGRDKGYLRD